LRDKVKTLKNMNKKFKFVLNGMEFSLPSKHLRTKDWGGNPIKPEI